MPFQFLSLSIAFHCAIVPWKFILVSEVQLKNAPINDPMLLILVTLSGIVMLVSELHMANEAPPILVTPSGITILVSELQL